MERETGFEPATLTLATLGSLKNGTNTYLSETPINLTDLDSLSVSISLENTIGVQIGVQIVLFFDDLLVVCLPVFAFVIGRENSLHSPYTFCFIRVLVNDSLKSYYIFLNIPLPFQINVYTIPIGGSG